MMTEMPDPTTGATEPSAQVRSDARHTAELYIALVEQGFTHTQALWLVAQVLAHITGHRRLT